MPIKLKIYCQKNDDDYTESLNKYSSYKDLVFIPLLPVDHFSSDEEYMDYLRKLFRLLPKQSPCLLVSHYDMVDHKEMYFTNLRS